MAHAVEVNAQTSVKSGQRSASESRLHKVVKKSKDRKPAKIFDADTVFEAIEDNSSEIEGNANGKDKKAQGIVIDGKTYTCATCKTGHRVGVCKHARERPMTATHPPGRPPAGAPKKVVCDCPKQCNCKKSDCKCARNCSCTQMMYMLVYVPAPGKEQDDNDEEGTWTLGQQVTTDLKGNVLTLEQVKERQEQKEAQKSQTPEGKGRSISTAIDEPRPKKVLKEEPIFEPSTSCCSHKEKVASQNIAAVAAPQSDNAFKLAARGCNCGQTCSCTFCPEHPNNPASVDMARQQAMHFTNHHRNIDEQSIVPFIPLMPQRASCMGYAPQYAVSRTSGMPSYADLQRMFPNPGFVIQYPFWSLRTDEAGYPVAPFPVQHSFPSNIGAVSDSGFNELQTPLATPQVELPHLEFSQDEFGIGNAFVTSAGPGRTEVDLQSPSLWPMESAIVSPTAENYFENPNLVGNESDHRLVTTMATMGNGFGFGEDPFVLNENGLFDATTTLHRLPMAEGVSQMSPARPCCGNLQSQDDFVEFFENPHDYLPSSRQHGSASATKPFG